MTGKQQFQGSFCPVRGGAGEQLSHFEPSLAPRDTRHPSQPPTTEPQAGRMRKSRAYFSYLEENDLWKPPAVSSECHWPEAGHVTVLRPGAGRVDGDGAARIWPLAGRLKVMDTPLRGVLRGHSRDKAGARG